MPEPVTPAELRELAARAQALAAEIRTAHNRLRAAADEPTQRCGFRLDDAAGEADRVGEDLAATAEDLARVRGRSDCGADWGVCPEHGATLRSSGGESWCTAPGCGRRWDHNRYGLPCAEPAAYEVRDSAGTGGRMCAGHAKHAHEQLVGAVVTPLVSKG